MIHYVPAGPEISPEWVQSNANFTSSSTQVGSYRRSPVIGSTTSTAYLTMLSTSFCTKTSFRPGRPTQSSSALDSFGKSWSLRYQPTLSAASTSLTESTCELARLSIANSSTNLREWWTSELLLVVSSPTLWTLSHTSSSGWMKPLTRPCKRRQRVGHESILSSSTQRTIGRWESQSSELSVLACKLAA